MIDEDTLKAWLADTDRAAEREGEGEAAMTRVDGWPTTHGLDVLYDVERQLQFVRDCGVRGDGGEVGDPGAQRLVADALVMVSAAITLLQAAKAEAVPR